MHSETSAATLLTVSNWPRPYLIMASLNVAAIWSAGMTRPDPAPAARSAAVMCAPLRLIGLAVHDPVVVRDRPVNNLPPTPVGNPRRWTPTATRGLPLAVRTFDQRVRQVGVSDVCADGCGVEVLDGDELHWRPPKHWAGKESGAGIW